MYLFILARNEILYRGTEGPILLPSVLTKGIMKLEQKGNLKKNKSELSKMEVFSHTSH